MDDIIKHYRFLATLSLRTPLAVLVHHGETHPGPHNALPAYATAAEGVWLPVTKSWAELAGPKAKYRPQHQQAKPAPDPLGTMASDVGPIRDDGGDYLPFLKAFRAIVESGDAAESKRAKIAALASESRFQQFAAVHKKRLDSWPL